MKSKLLLTSITILIPLLSACGVKAVPTIDPAQVQTSAVAVVKTMIAMTQTAMPTETPVPPTDTSTNTPQPTLTISPLPSTEVLASPPAAVLPTSSSAEACSGAINANKGELLLKSLLINNKTKVVVGISIYLNKNTFGDCGFWSTPTGVSANSSTSISNFFPSNSCYHVTAYTLSGKPNFTVGTDFCAGFSGDKFTLNVTESGIGIVGP